MPANNFEQRGKVLEAYKKRHKSAPEQDSFKMLTNLRNQVAHGNSGNIKLVQKTLLDESKMRQELERLLTDIENGNFPS